VAVSEQYLKCRENNECMANSFSGSESWIPFHFLGAVLIVRRHPFSKTAICKGVNKDLSNSIGLNDEDLSHIINEVWFIDEMCLK
jgi:hypothetical protein